ncbi:50S ribosomal protein L15 [Candidatus Gottesmanbacteria bacterium RIFCSPHIGHO2_02_FULL_39_14]|uniref:Large ribosomal subunit protein uL15 n=2 Tax=Candidatus Gottesmaniibacteriota TaxID=1752720 RepID=A0A1F5ZU28_9BACT|nr:MAG: 50S ribosomal protein L15 [Candidatus Gottesmanbacteria bacterium RIFCSPHIGHO2_02_FULL_39_14]OGG31113.1 MAG: 50S ribosomal protein L15 [Candidatus Gottesmanbacteria bacterium RIFCSPLOWO2_02_FULL_38_8]
MADLSKLPKIKENRKKRLGQGHGSGKGKTAGRGTKGQKSREKISTSIKLAGVSFVKRLPLFRGKGRHKRISSKPLVINIKDLADLTENTVIDLDFLVKKRLVKKDQAQAFGIKILGEGSLKIPLIVKLPTSKNASKKIEKAGGKVEVNPERSG